MIRGQVNARKEAVIPLQIRGAGGQTVDRQGTIDTGFSGFLTLPLALIVSLQLTLVETRTYTLGNNSNIDFDLYAATVIWDGKDRNVLVLATDSGTLVGMSMLQGYRLFVDVVDSGDVIIEERP